MTVDLWNFMRGGSNQNMKRMIIGKNRRNWNEKLEGNGERMRIEKDEDGKG